MNPFQNQIVATKNIGQDTNHTQFYFMLETSTGTRILKCIGESGCEQIAAQYTFVKHIESIPKFMEKENV